MPSSEKFFVGIFRENGRIIGHTSASSAQEASSLQEDISESKEKTAKANPSPSPFCNTFDSFVGIMNSYRNFVPITLSIGHALLPAISEERLEKFLKAKGQVVNDVSDAGKTIYELSVDFVREFSIRQQEVIAVSRGKDHMPEAMIVGLISSYDAFLTNLLKTVFQKHNEIVLKSDRTIPYSEISRFSSIEAARDFLINKEVESVLRLSHHEQFDWMENTFRMKLRENLAIWPKFVELCERRNLFTHSGGIVSQQYINCCTQNKCYDSKIKLGDKLEIDSDYFDKSVSIVYELGVKLCYVFWRKFHKDDQQSADTHLNELCFDLTFYRAYELSESILKFGVSTLEKSGEERTKKMMIVNLANCMRLQEKKKEAEEVIDKVDWSASGNEFKIGAAAAKGDVAEVIKIMKTIGNSDEYMDMESYRSWPLFRETRKNPEFQKAFSEIFGQDIIRTTAMILPQTEEGKAEIQDKPTIN